MFGFGKEKPPMGDDPQLITPESVTEGESVEAVGDEVIKEEKVALEEQLRHKFGSKFNDAVTGVSMWITGTAGAGALALSYEVAGKEPSQIIVSSGLALSGICALTITAVCGKQLGLLQRRNEGEQNGTN